MNNAIRLWKSLVVLPVMYSGVVWAESFTAFSYDADVAYPPQPVLPAQLSFNASYVPADGWDLRESDVRLTFHPPDPCFPPDPVHPPTPCSTWETGAAGGLFPGFSRRISGG